MEEDNNETNSVNTNFLIGHLGGEEILNGLSQTNLPLQYIDQFQQNNCIDKSNLPTVSPVLKLLDLHQIGRGDLYLNLLSLLRDDLLKKVNTLNNKELEALLEQTFPYIGFDELKIVPMTVMKRLTPAVPIAYLERLAETTDLYEQCPMEVKRQIWMINESLFRSRVEPLIYQYIEDPHLQQELNELLGSSTDHVPSRRREANLVLQELLSIIGKSPQLYNMLVDLIKKLFQDTENYLLCNLRAEILMATHDQDIQEIYQTDPTHNFAWCMDASTRDQSMDVRRIKDIQTYFQTQSISNNNPILVDIAMVFANPVASHCLLNSIIHQLRDVVKRKQVPKDDENVKYLTYLLSLGLKSYEMVKTSKYKIPHVKKQITQLFYPIITNQIQEDINKDAIRLSISSTPPISGSSSTTPTTPTSEQSPLSSSTAGAGQSQPTPIQQTQSSSDLLEVDINLEALYIKFDICKQVILTYIIKRISERDTVSIDKYLKFLSQLVTKLYSNQTISASGSVSVQQDFDYSGNETYTYFGNDFIQSCVTQVLAVKDNKVATVVIDNFLMKYKSVPFIHKQLLRYLLETYIKMGQRDLISFVQKLYSYLATPTNSNIKNTKESKKLQDDIATMTKVFLDKAGTRLNEKNVPLLYEYLKSKQIQSSQVQPTNITTPPLTSEPISLIQSSSSPSTNINESDNINTAEMIVDNSKDSPNPMEVE